MKAIKWGMLALALNATGCAAMPGRISTGIPIDIDSSFGIGPRYLQDGEGVNGEAMVKLLEAEPASSSDVQTARAMRIVSMIFAGVGGALIGVPLGQAEGGERNPMWVLAGVGAGAITLSIPFSILGVYSMDNAVEAYNSTLKTERTSEPKPAPSMEQKPQFATGSPPGSAAGFLLGSDVATVEARCVGTGFAWEALNDRQFSCSGTPADVGMPATVKLSTCAGHVCKVAVKGSFEGATFATLMEPFEKLSKLLEGSHGTQAVRETKALEDCTDKLPQCFAAGRVRKSMVWNWPNEQKVSLILWGGPVGGAPSLHVFYSTPAYAEGKP